MKIKTYLIKIVLAFLLVANIILTFFVVCSVALGGMNLYRVWTTKHTLTSLRAQLRASETKLQDARAEWLSLAEAESETFVNIRNWHEQDRMHFKELFHDRATSKDMVYQEYLSLNGKLTELDKNAYHDPKGYTLYAPELTEAIFALIAAVNSRELLLADLAFNRIKSSDSYYYKDLNSTRNKFVEAHNKEIIQPRERFEAYDQGEIINALNNLPIPDYYFHGLKIFFVNAQSNLISGVTLASYSNNNPIIIVFNQPNMDTDRLIRTLIHEIGHIVEKKIFYEYKKDDDGFLVRHENKQALLEYAKIYNKSEYLTEYDTVNKGEWVESLPENFAEDFVSIYLGAQKITSWQGNHGSQVKAFIEEKIEVQNTFKLSSIKDVKIISGESVSNLALRTTIPCTFYTKNPTVSIKVEDVIANDSKIEAKVYSDNYHTIARMNDENQIVLHFSRKGEYNIYIGSNTSNSPFSEIVYFGVTVIYDP